MFSLINQQVFEIKELMSQVQRGRRGSTPLAYARALQLIYAILRQTQKELESIYYSYVLRPTLQTQNSIAVSCLYVIAKLANERKTTTFYDMVV